MNVVLLSKFLTFLREKEKGERCFVDVCSKDRRERARRKNMTGYKIFVQH
jgi:hypothetical protein